MLRFAAVDIGSNAVRLLFEEVNSVNDAPVFKKLSLVRLPIRLGEEAFCDGFISDHNVNKLLNAMSAFKQLLKVYEVQDYRVCATAAIRKAGNRKEIIHEIARQTGIVIEAIEGTLEAKLIYSNHIERLIDEKGVYLYADVGGGSTEMTLFYNGENIKSYSFDIGTLRLKDHIIDSRSWSEMRKWLEDIHREYNPEMLIGTGGNINRIYKMCGLKNYALLNRKKLNESYEYLSGFSVEQRISKLNLRPDRADVIVPAAQIFLFILNHSHIKNIFVPKIGLADGIIHELYNKYISKKKADEKKHSNSDENHIFIR